MHRTSGRPADDKTQFKVVVYTDDGQSVVQVLQPFDNLVAANLALSGIRPPPFKAEIIPIEGD